MRLVLALAATIAVTMIFFAASTSAQHPRTFKSPSGYHLVQ